LKTTNDQKHFQNLLGKSAEKITNEDSDSENLLRDLNFENLKKTKKPRRQTIHFTLSQKTIDLLEEASRRMGDGNRSGTLEKILLDVFENKGRGLFGI
jgi:hypothetical protein